MTHTMVLRTTARWCVRAGQTGRGTAKQRDVNGISISCMCWGSDRGECHASVHSGCHEADAARACRLTQTTTGAAVRQKISKNGMKQVDGCFLRHFHLIPV